MNGLVRGVFYRVINMPRPRGAGGKPRISSPSAISTKVSNGSGHFRNVRFIGALGSPQIGDETRAGRKTQMGSFRELVHLGLL